MASAESARVQGEEVAENPMEFFTPQPVPPKPKRVPAKTAPKKIAICPIVKELRKPQIRVPTGGRLKYSRQADLIKRGTANFLIATEFERNEYDLETFTATLTNDQGAVESEVPIPKMKRPHTFPPELSKLIEHHWITQKPLCIKFSWPEIPFRHMAVMTMKDSPLEKVVYLKNAVWEECELEEEQEISPAQNEDQLNTVG